MKINQDGLHPLYDQYSNDENRLTHALLHTISSSKWLFSRFLKNLVGVNGPLGNETYEISTQKVPFSHGDKKPEGKKGGHPLKGLSRKKHLSVEKMPPFFPLTPTPAPVRCHFHPPAPRPLLLSRWFWLSPNTRE